MQSLIKAASQKARISRPGIGIGVIQDSEVANPSVEITKLTQLMLRSAFSYV